MWRLALAAALLGPCVVADTVPADSALLWWSGRAVSNSSGRFFDYPNVAAFAVRATDVSVTIAEAARQRYHVYASGDSVGGQQWALLATVTTGPSGGAPREYVLASGLLASSMTTIVLSKITEPDYNAGNETYSVTRVVSFSASGGDGAILAAPSALLPDAARRLEFIGDSLTAGYGSARFAPCRGSVFVEDGDAAWARALCVAFNASCHVEAWSGRGLVQNYVAEEPGSHMPQIVRRTFASVPVEDWAWASWVPSAVFVHLGSNDFCCGRTAVPGFDVAYLQLLRNISAVYRDARTGRSPPVLAAVLHDYPALWNGTTWAVQQAVADGIDARMVDMRATLRDPSMFGCDGHPSTLGHRAMATAAVPVLEAATGWAHRDLSPVSPLPY